MGKFQKRKFERPSFMDKPNYKSIGYARVSTSGQTTEGQVTDLKKEGCCVVFQETISTTVKEKERPQLMAALSALDEGDELVVTKMDRLGRTQVEVVNRIHDLQQQRIHIRTLDGLINTRGLGKFAPVLIGLLSGLAEVERSLTRERTIESIQHRKETGGNLGGRPKTSRVKEGLVLRLRKEGCSYRSIREQTGLALSTIRRIIVEQEIVTA
ncbi:recombinase family protein [Prochlorococcus marinus]|uniref:recombinase family protein n=1 Tax=Prochlorococcus TaxID=1218 RepID=UPI0009BD3D26|nr:recombinase family protein [Prochlorococcus marinus]